MKKLLENAKKNIGQLKARVAKADTNLELVYSCEGDDLQWYQDMIVRKIVGNEETAVTGPDGWGLSDDDIMFSELVVSLLPSTDENTGMIKIKEAVLPGKRSRRQEEPRCFEAASGGLVAWIDPDYPNVVLRGTI